MLGVVNCYVCLHRNFLPVVWMKAKADSYNLASTDTQTVFVCDVRVAGYL